MRSPSVFRYSLFLLVIAGVFVSLATLREINAQGIPSLSVQTACLKSINCTEAGANCVNHDGGVNMKVHRVLLTLESTLRSQTVFFDECIDLPEYGKTCFTTPVTSDGTIPYFLDNDTSSQGPVGHAKVEMFKEGRYLRCMAQYGNSDQMRDPCRTESNTYFTERLTAIENSGYEFNGVFIAGGSGVTALTPIETYPLTGQAGSSYEWSSKTNAPIGHSYGVMAFYSGALGDDADSPSDKISQLDFLASSAVCQPTSFHDPYGVVFNKTNLESVEGAKVVLYERKQILGTTEYQYTFVPARVNQAPVLENPQTTGPLGTFTYVVTNGVYKLLVLNPGGIYPSSFVDSEFTEVQLAQYGSVMDLTADTLGVGGMIKVGKSARGPKEVLYPEVYQVSQDGVTGLVTIPEIQEDNKVERRDVSVTKTSARVKVFSWEIIRDSLGNRFVSGIVNKPYATVKIHEVAEDQTLLGVVVETVADVHGNFQTAIAYDATDAIHFKPVAQKGTVVSSLGRILGHVPKPVFRVASFIDLLITKTVQAQEYDEDVQTELLPLFIQGYAYNNTGAKLPDAVVTVRDLQLGITTYTTTTDATGFFTIPSNRLPANEFVLYYQPKDSTEFIRTTAKTFLTQNKTYLAENNIDLGKPNYSQAVQTYLTQHPAQIVSGVPQVSVGPDTGPIGPDGMPISQTPGINTTGKPDEPVNPVRAIPPQLLMLVAILFLLIVGAGLLIVYFMRKRQEPHLYE